MSCGIMSRMENSNLDETRPIPVGKATQDVQDTAPTSFRQATDPLQATAVTPIFREREAGGATQTVSVYQEKSPPGDMEPSAVEDGAGNGSAPPARSGWMSWKFWAAIGIAALFLIAAISAYGGYRTGIEQRTSFGATQVAQEVGSQFTLALQDAEAKRFDLARQRLEWVIQNDPDYPGAIEKLSEVLLALNTTATPTVAPTPTLTPTPDLRSVEELYSQGKQLLAAGEWSQAIDTLLKLRKDAPDLHTVEVDGLLYVALRNRGVQKIKSADLEGGTYDLALAERFGPLDIEARNWRDWSEWYITGASFWEVDWPQVINYFSQLVQVVPNLMDGSGWTTSDRYREALQKYGDQLAASGEWCLAQEQYDLAQEFRSDPNLQPTASYAAEQCAAPDEDDSSGLQTETPTPTPPSGENTPTPPSGEVTPTPPSATEEATPSGEATPEPSPIETTAVP